MAIIGQLSITTEEGVTLTADNDLRLAWLWAEHANGAAWGSLRYVEQCQEVAAALTALREAFGEN
ncbi:hypothetical protein [uncultured Brachybacterium sp.]|uniref:hypothetical protein n=1 Tax=uncultured Brachybacterium sp. TaxID=189680 RepID=UPI0026069449|nr:hypothetical protein [uncultured Brachybacterium sp.]